MDSNPDGAPPGPAHKPKARGYFPRFSRLLPDDGFSWHKYGHKNLADETYSRSYYKCAHRRTGCKARRVVDLPSSPSFPLRMTYEGEHNHQPTSPISQAQNVIVQHKAGEQGKRHKAGNVKGLQARGPGKPTGTNVERASAREAFMASIGAEIRQEGGGPLTQGEREMEAIGSSGQPLCFHAAPDAAPSMGIPRDRRQGHVRTEEPQHLGSTRLVHPHDEGIPTGPLQDIATPSTALPCDVDQNWLTESRIKGVHVLVSELLVAAQCTREMFESPRQVQQQVANSSDGFKEALPGIDLSSTSSHVNLGSFSCVPDESPHGLQQSSSSNIRTGGFSHSRQRSEGVLPKLLDGILSPSDEAMTPVAREEQGEEVVEMDEGPTWTQCIPLHADSPWNNRETVPLAFQRHHTCGMDGTGGGVRECCGLVFCGILGKKDSASDAVDHEDVKPRVAGSPTLAAEGDMHIRGDTRKCTCGTAKNFLDFNRSFCAATSPALRRVKASPGVEERHDSHVNEGIAHCVPRCALALDLNEFPN